MLEESRMDKKSINRLSQPQSRASAIDCKKSTELTHKPWLRNNKKRDGSGAAPKNEPFRRNPPSQRGRGQIDKRSRARGTNFIVGGTQNAGIEPDEEPEIGSVYQPGSKKQNLNHLLNFMYPTRGGFDRRGSVPRRPVQNMAHKHQHDLYLRAYCQFVVKDGDYEVNLMDPDMPIKWEQIEEVVVRSTGRSECPICLGTPVAGRVDHCGHVYCWACVLHYAAAHEKQPPPCPVCAAPLQVNEMKPAYMIQWESPAEEVTMRLVRRLRGTTTVEVAPPRGQIKNTLATPILPLENLNNAPFTKYFTATKEQVFKILEKEREEINNQILAEIDTTEIVYLERALELLKLKEEAIKNQVEKPKPPEVVENMAPIEYEKQEISDKKLDWFDISEEGAACIEVITENMASLEVTDPDLNSETVDFLQDELNDNNQTEEFPLIECAPPGDEPVNNDNLFSDIDKENQAKYFYFYQAEDGQQVFLNSLNVRILNASWGGLVTAPSVVRGRVLHRETLSLADQARKHMPYTAHLPVYCSFDIVELDLQPPFVTTAALESFSDELRRRARVRANLERKERRRELQYRRAMEGPPRPDFSSEVQFPRASTSFGSPTLMETVSVSPTESSQSPSNSVRVSEQTSSNPSPSSSGLSFAKMASTSGTWRVRKTALPSPSPPDADEASGPRALVLSDAIEAALHAAPSPSSKKNKKSKPKVLFATGMQRTG